MADNKALAVLGKRELPAHLRERREAGPSDWDRIGGEAVPRIVVTRRKIEAHMGNTVVAESRDPITVVMLKAGPVGRVYYYDTYQDGDTQAPDCYSLDGEVPAPDARYPESRRCDTCPQNQKGSSRTKRDSKACRYRQNVAIAIPGQDEIFRLSLPATAIFDPEPNEDGMMALNAYVKTLRASDATPDMVWTEVGPDEFSETARAMFYPKGWIEDERDYAWVQRLLDDKKRLDKILNAGDEGAQETARSDGDRHDDRGRDREDSRDRGRDRDDHDGRDRRSSRDDRVQDRDRPRGRDRDERDVRDDRRGDRHERDRDDDRRGSRDDDRRPRGRDAGRGPGDDGRDERDGDSRRADRGRARDDRYRDDSDERDSRGRDRGRGDDHRRSRDRDDDRDPPRGRDARDDRRERDDDRRSRDRDEGRDDARGSDRDRGRERGRDRDDRESGRGEERSSRRDDREERDRDRAPRDEDRGEARSSRRDEEDAPRDTGRRETTRERDGGRDDSSRGDDDARSSARADEEPRSRAPVSARLSALQDIIESEND